MTNVQQAVARVENNAAPAQVTPATMVRHAIEKQSGAFRAVLPKSVDPERFSRLVLTAVKSTPELMKCFATEQGEMSVLLAAMQAAAIGLEPNTPTQDCWLLPRQNKGVWECQLSIGYRGQLKLARRSDTIKTIFAEVVRESDVFSWQRGLEADELEHIPGDGTGELTHAYAVARFMNGGYAFMVLNRTQIEARRAMSDSWRNDRARPYSPWTKWPEAMWRKSAIRALIPYLDLTAESARALGSDEVTLTFNEDDGIVEAHEADEPIAELEQPGSPPEAAADTDRQEPGSPLATGAPADAGTTSSSEGAPPASDGTVDPASWTGEEWRAQLAAHKRKVTDAIREAQTLSKGDKPPATLDDLAGNRVLAQALADWMRS